MTRRLLFRVPVLAVTVLLTASFAMSERASAPTSLRRDNPLLITRHRAAGLDYMVVQPSDLPLDAELPMVVYVHGRGGRVLPPKHAPFGLKRPVRFILPQAPDRYGRGFSWMPVSGHYGETPQLVDALSQRTRQLANALVEWRRRHPTRGKPIVVGFSQGGMLAMTLATHHPDAIAQAIGIAAWLPPSLMPSGRGRYDVNAPILALHGTADRVLPADRTQQTIEELARRGFDARFEAFEGVSHRVALPVRARARVQIERALERLPETRRSSGHS